MVPKMNKFYTSLYFRLRQVIEVKNKELATRENDLREIILKHERDLEVILQKENISIEDHVRKVLEGKLKDTSDLLDGKVGVHTFVFCI